MALARIRTHFPDEVSELSEALVAAGYVVETLRPDEFRIGPAELELTVEKLPVVEAWRHVPNAEAVYISPGTPESADIRSAVGVEISREPIVARLVVEAGEGYAELKHWMSRQARELRGRAHDCGYKLSEWRRKMGDLRKQWTPPREYHAEVHLEPTAPSSVEHPVETPVTSRIDSAIEQARIQQEELRRRQEAEQRELQEQARLAEENRRRAREAAEAKALLEEQRRIEAMVRTTERMREQVVESRPPAPRKIERQRPRLLPRTRRERAFFRAGIAAFVVSVGIGMLASEMLHPRPASGALPTKSVSTAVPFAKSNTVPAGDAQPTPAAQVPVPSLIPSPALIGTAPAPITTASLKSPGPKAVARHSTGGLTAQDEVIVRKYRLNRPSPPKRKDTIAHYSDLD